MQHFGLVLDINGNTDFQKILIIGNKFIDNLFFLREVNETMAQYCIIDYTDVFKYLYGKQFALYNEKYLN